MSDPDLPPLLDERVIDDLREDFSSTGDLDELAGLIRNFIASSAEQVAAVCDAVDTRDGEAVRTTAHRLKGSSGTLGAGRLGAVARQVEEAGAAGDVSAAVRACRELEVVYASTRSALSEVIDDLAR